MASAASISDRKKSSLSFFYDRIFGTLFMRDEARMEYFCRGLRVIVAWVNHTRYASCMRWCVHPISTDLAHAQLLGGLL